MSDNIINIQIPMVISTGSTSKSKRTLRKLQNLISHISKGTSEQRISAGPAPQHSLRSSTFSGGKIAIHSNRSNSKPVQQRNS